MPDFLRMDWRRFALPASLLLNLFLAGLLIGGAFDGKPGPDRAAPFDWRAAQRALTDDQRQQVRTLWRQHRETVRARLAGIEAARETLRQALTAERLDPTAVTAAQSQLHLALESMRQGHGELTMAIAAALPDEARRAYFDKALAATRAERP